MWRCACGLRSALTAVACPLKSLKLGTPYTDDAGRSDTVLLSSTASVVYRMLQLQSRRLINSLELMSRTSRRHAAPRRPRTSQIKPALGLLVVFAPQTPVAVGNEGEQRRAEG